MNKILFLPVDERFCTRDYFIHMASAAGLEVLTPEKRMLGMNKIQPDMGHLHDWVRNNISDVKHAILSMDMLIHGGLIPSRMSLDLPETLENRMGILKELKQENITVYASVCVTRAPFYDSAEEEPDYWQYFGKKIYDYSREIVKQGINIHEKGVNLPQTDIPQWIVDDFIWRRRRNFKMIQKSIECVGENTIDFLNLTLDDNSEGSMSLFEAALHQKLVDEKKLNDRVSIHAGADESTLTLLSRLLCDITGTNPEFKITYLFPEYAEFIPAYEGRPLKEGLRSHIESAGGKVVEGNGDILLAVNNPREKADGMHQKSDASSKDKCCAFVEKCNASEGVKGYVNIKYTNGSDNDFIDKLLDSRPDWHITNVSGWNTAGNTIGTVCAHSIIQFMISKGLIEGDIDQMKTLQYIFLMEHWGFQSNARKELLERAMNEKDSKPWSLIAIEDWALDLTKKLLKPYSERIAHSIGIEIEDFELFFPWHRSFELGITIKRKEAV